MHTSYWNTFRDNLISESNAGIDMWSNDNALLHNKFVNNIIANNSWIGIRFANDWSKGNMVYLNKFINNDKNSEDNGQINYWDNGSIGNYWDDYGGNDDNDDGIGETPYDVPPVGGSVDNFPIWDDGHNGSIIVIDDSASNNWEWATQYTWCSGSGTKEDPYVITGANIDGKNSSNCINIKNSNVNFIIKDSTVYNSSGDMYNYAGIVLENTFNGTLINNNCSNNNGNGITLFGCSNITIQECICNNNGWAGITLISGSLDNLIINSSINENLRGIELYTNCNNNKIIENTLENNWNRDIRVSVADFNLIKRNHIKGGGIMLNGNNNTACFNEIYYCNNGIYFGGSNYYNIIANNSIHDNSNGIHIEHSVCQETLLYNNSFIGNGLHAFDDGMFNNWDNGVIGNYWDDYPSVDVNDDGIGDIIYNITGLADSIDNLPIWWDAPVFNIISPASNDEFENTAPSYAINITEGLEDTMWYTLDDGLTNTTFTSFTGVINQVLWWVVPLGDVLVRFYVNDSRGWISFQEVPVIKILEYWILSNFIIDDIGGGDYTWAEAVVEGWCRGSGTLNNPFIIEFVKIDGQNLGSCLIIRNSTVYFRIKNCTFYNSGSDQHDAGIKLLDVSNGELIFLNCSNNNGNGIVVDSCQNISIKSSSVNHNGLNGILLIDSIYINIMDNVETINYNDEYGIYLIRSHNNEITGNTINNNRVGIYLDQSNSNFIDWNNLNISKNS
ncbi:hypothetical protein ES703_89824 [subsurface metagenome]